MSETLRTIDELLKALDRHVAELRAEAKEAGFSNMALGVDWSCIHTNPTNVRVFLTTGWKGDNDSVEAPTAEDAYTECARRLNWQRDVAMKRIGAAPTPPEGK